MKISNGTIDCWLYIYGQNQGQLSNSYYDFQHHHWDIMSSATIDTMQFNFANYIWTLTVGGRDVDGSWSAINEFQPSLARVSINMSSNMVILEQKEPFGTNKVTATGTSVGTTHDVPEAAWPKSGSALSTLTWSPSANTPITYKDPMNPSYIIVSIPTGGKKSLHRLALVPSGGQDWKQNNSQYYQTPSGYTARAWWAWNINLSP